MLTNASVHAVLPATDIERARNFYEGVLGLQPISNPAGSQSVLYSTKGGQFLVYQTTAPTGSATSLSFTVDDIAAEMDDLRKKGVVFEDYDLPGLKTVNGLAELEGMGKAAWFKDSEGNILNIDQMD